jgi:hypothetical protein
VEPHPILRALDADLGAVELAQHLAHRDLGASGRGAELSAVARRRILVLEELVQPRGMRRIDADLERLQPVAVPVALEGERVLVRRDEAVEVRERRRLAGAEVGEQDAALLGDGIGLLPDVLAHAAAFGLGRRGEALAAYVEQPTVEAAAQPAVLEPAVGEVGAAMRAMPFKQPVPVFLFEQDQVFAKQPHRLHRPRSLQLFGEGDRLPVVAQQRSGRRARPDAGHELVLLGADHPASSR